jgi:hypothetical protein
MTSTSYLVQILVPVTGSQRSIGFEDEVGRRAVREDA